MKKYIIIAGIFVFVALGLALKHAQQKKVSFPALDSEEPSQGLLTLSPPAFPPPVATQPNYSVLPIGVSFPKELPEYRIKTDQTKNGAGTIAAALGFSGAPRAVSGPGGTIQAWTTGGTSLTIGGNPVMIDYFSGFQAAGPIGASLAAQESASLFILQKINASSPPYQLLKLPPKYYKASGLDLISASPGTATIVELGYSASLDSRIVYGRKPQDPTVRVRLNSRSEIVSFSATLYPTVEKSGGSIAVSSISAVSARLSNKEGVLLYLFSDEDRDSFSGPQYSVSSVTVESLSLGYYYSPGATSLVPVFLAEGTGQDNNSEKSVRFMTLVSALR